MGILAILAFGIIVIPKETNAQYGGYISTIKPATVKADNPTPIINSIDPNYSNVGVGTKTITITGENFVPDSVGKVNGANRPTTFVDSYHLLMQINGNDLNAYQSNGGFFITVFNPAPAGGYSGTVFFTISNNANGTGSNFSNTSQTGNGNNTGGNSGNQNGNYRNLASNALFGSNSIYPSGLIQWILLAIIILLIVILVRRLYGADKYHSTPLKHD